MIEDGDVTIGESGAIVEYILERYGDGRLAPPIGSPLRGQFLQWIHFAEGTAFPPLGVIVWHTLYEGDADTIPSAIESARERAAAALDVVERALAQRPTCSATVFRRRHHRWVYSRSSRALFLVSSRAVSATFTATSTAFRAAGIERLRRGVTTGSSAGAPKG